VTDRRLLAAVGVAAAGIGLVAVAYPGLVAGLSTVQVVVPLFGVVAVVQGVRAFGSRPESLRYAETPNPETRAVSVPGESFDAALAARSDAVRSRLESAAVAVLTQHGDCDEAEARDRLRAGTWTDDREAAAFFSPEVRPDAAGSLGGRIRTSLGATADVRAQARRVVATLAAVVEDDDTPRDFDGSDSPPDRYDPSSDLDAAPGEPADRRTGRWRGTLAFALVAGGAGMLARSPGLLLACGTGIAVAAYARIATPPAVALDVERTLSDPDPSPGDEIAVTLTVRNAGEQFLPDVTVVDGVPPELSVAEETPRCATALRAGEAATVSYAVEAELGDHEFEPVTVVARDFSGAAERTTRVECETTVGCSSPLSATGRVPLRDQTSGHAGRIATDVGGAGIEFYGVREYRPGDPLSRIDWNQRAKTGELTTLEFRESHAATVVVVVDGRETARLAPAPDERSAVARSVEGAGAAVASLLDSGEQVGVAALAPEECWLAPGAGRRHRGRARDLLSSHSALFGSLSGRFLPTATEHRLRSRLPDDAQVVLFSPLGDDYASALARRLDAAGHRVTVVSPDPTTDGTPGQLLARVERAVRVSSLRAVGVPVTDWATDESLRLALDRARRSR